MSVESALGDAIGVGDDSRAAACVAANPSLAAASIIVDGQFAGRAAPPLVHACFLGLRALVDAVIEAAPSCVNQPGPDGGTALHWAAWVGDAWAVQRLIAAGATVECRCAAYDATALWWACHGHGQAPRERHPCAHLDVVRMLVGAGASTNVVSRYHATALECAEHGPDNALASYLIERDGTEGVFFT